MAIQELLMNEPERAGSRMDDSNRMPRFNWDERIRISDDASAPFRPGTLANIVGIYSGASRRGQYFDRFAPGTVYTVEFDDGKSVDIHEDDIEPALIT